MFSTERFNHFLEKYHRLVAVLIFLGIVFFGWLILLRPQLKNIKQTGTLHIRRIKENLQEREHYLVQLQTMEKNFEKINLKALAKLNHLFYQEDELIYLYAELEALFKKYNLEIQALNITKEKTEGLAEVNVIANLTGALDYAKFKEVLVSLENNVRLLDLTSLNFTPGEGTSTFNFKTYYLSNEKE